MAGILRALPDPVLVVDASARLLWANDAAEHAFGWSLPDLVGTAVDHLVHPDDLETAFASLASVQRKDVGSVIEVRLRGSDGEYRTFEVRGRDATDDPEIGGIVLALRDITDRARWEIAHGDAGLYRAILDNAPAITMLLDSFGRLRGASRALTARLGRDLETTLGHHLRELVVPADAITVEAELALAMSQPGQRSFEVTFTTKDGGAVVPMSLTVVNLLTDRTVEGLVVSAVDITDLAESRARLHHLANHDVLTALPNRGALTARLEEALDDAARRDTPVTLIYCDLDGFKSVNDRYGHLAGDHVLKEIAHRLTSATRSADTVARMGGDEFVVLVPEGTPQSVQTLLARIEAGLLAPITLPTGPQVQVGVTTGVASVQGRGDVDDLLARADAAMYDAKRRKRESAT
jgi:diguanylate cyclase (GGDEF)-like protein/PAS domain S-box-containing protein